MDSVSTDEGIITDTVKHPRMEKWRQNPDNRDAEREREAERRAKMLENETSEEREARLKKQREACRRYRARKRELKKTTGRSGLASHGYRPTRYVYKTVVKKTKTIKTEFIHSIHQPPLSKGRTTGRLFHVHRDEGEVDVQGLELHDGDLVDPDNEDDNQSEDD